jgi:hypothetical protein
MADTRVPLWGLLDATMNHQERFYGPFVNDVAGARLALAVLADELAEALEAWREERRQDDWSTMHVEVLQLAAVACRLLMDTGLPEHSAAWVAL